jgi:hypothetical protein
MSTNDTEGESKYKLFTEMMWLELEKNSFFVVVVVAETQKHFFIPLIRCSAMYFLFNTFFYVPPTLSYAILNVNKF